MHESGLWLRPIYTSVCSSNHPNSTSPLCHCAWPAAAVHFFSIALFLDLCTDDRELLLYSLRKHCKSDRHECELVSYDKSYILYRLLRIQKDTGHYPFFLYLWCGCTAWWPESGDRTEHCSPLPCMQSAVYMHVRSCVVLEKYIQRQHWARQTVDQRWDGYKRVCSLLASRTCVCVCVCGQHRGWGFGSWVRPDYAATI